MPHSHRSPLNAGNDGADEVIVRWRGMIFRDPAREQRYLRELRLKGFVQSRAGILCALLFVVLSGAMGYFLYQTPEAQAKWARAMTVRGLILTPVWLAVYALSFRQSWLDRLGPWMAAAVPLSVLSFTLELMVSGGGALGDLRLLFPLLVYLGVGVLFSWTNRVLLPVSAACLAAGPLMLSLFATGMPATVRWNLWAVWISIVFFLLVGSRRRERVERELFLRRERQAQMLAELEASNEDLRQLNRMRNEFLTLAAHDLGNPLTVVMGNAAALADGTLREGTPESRDALDQLVESSRQMRELIHRFMDLPDRAAPAAPPSLRPLSVATLLHSLRPRLEALLEPKAQQLAIGETPPGLGIVADGGLLERALENLVRHASRVSANGARIAVGAHAETARALTRLQVRDQGPGIDLEERLTLFQRAAGPAVRPGRRDSELALAKSWVETMGGSVGYENAAGNGTGTSYWLTLPQVAVTPATGISLRKAPPPAETADPGKSKLDIVGA